MVRKILTKINEKGSLLIEAMAMLGLIAMVTPILYKKAAERTTEIRDINAAGEMRNLIKAVDDYLKDNYENIINGETVVIDNKLTSDASARSVDWSDFKAPNIGGVPQYKEYSKTVPIEHFAEYLPYGFLDENGKAVGSRTFRSYNVVVKKVDSGVLGQDKIGKQVLTGFVQGVPTEADFPMIRASRIASMVGSNGGYAILDNQVSGAQGIWGIDDVSSDLGLSGVKQGDVVTASIQSISSGAGDYEGVLYRVYRKDRRLNTMSTTLMMGDQSIKGTNQLLIHARGSNFDTGGGEDQANALMIFNDGDVLKPGARIQGRIAAAITGMKLVPGVDDEYTIDTSDIRERFLVDEESHTSVDATLRAALTEQGSTTDPTTGAVSADRASDKYNLEVEKEDVRVQNERMSVGQALRIYPVEPGSKSDKEENPTLLNDSTRIKMIADSGVVMETKTSDAVGTEMAVNHLGIVGNTTGSINYLTPAATFQMGAQDASGVVIDDEVGYGVADLYAQEWANVTSDNLVTISTAEDPDNNIGSSMITLDLNETEIASDFIDIVTNNYDLNTGSKIALQESDFAGLEEIYAHSDVIHLHAREELHLETDQDLRLTADHIYNEFEGPADPNAIGGGGSYHIAVINPRDGTNTAAQWRYETLYMDQGVTRMANKKEIALQAEEVNIGQFGTSNNLDDYNPVVSIKGDEAGLPNYGQEDGGTGTKELINIRRGVIEMTRNRGVDENDPRSYVQADRLVSPTARDSDNDDITAALPVFDASVTGTPYDAYQVNPRYTSVMHDIKLTTRGGARLSDILPDFINKGIYVVDTTYKEGAVTDWEGSDPPSANSPQASKHSRNDPVSPWAGFVPKPQCPPGYARVITLTPAGIAMAQAGIPATDLSEDIYLPTNINRDPFAEYTPENGYGMDPLFFQKNTWMRAKAYPHGDAANFKGWSAILGFIYPYVYYEDYINANKHRLQFPHGNINKDMVVIWNLFPMYRKELEAYATVYCYFDRKDTTYDNRYVDPYDQIGSYRQGYGKDPTYEKRLNDPTLKYTDPW